MISSLARKISVVGAAVTLLVGVAAATNADAKPTRPSQAELVRQQVDALRVELRNGTLAQHATVTKICKKNKLACDVEMVTPSKSSLHTDAFAPPFGYGAKELEKAYGVTSAPSSAGTIVVIGAGPDPQLGQDLRVYRQTYGLPACTSASGCFRQENYLGGPAYKPSTKNDSFQQYLEEELAVETSLDVDMASAACPNCKIVSMQIPTVDGAAFGPKATHLAVLHFATGVQTAHRQHASAVSISYGYPTDQYSDHGTIAAMMRVPGMPIVSSSGDGGFYEDFSSWPQDLPTVTSAGGTSLYPSGQGKNVTYSEVAWNEAGSGCTTDEPPAVGQPHAIGLLCDTQGENEAHRASSDVSAVADPYTGVAVYDSYAPSSGMPLGFVAVGGTSVSSPFIAGLYARAPHNASVIGPNTLYAKPASAFHDVTTGTNFGYGYCETVYYPNKICDAGKGWDGPTGLGTPNGLAAFK